MSRPTTDKKTRTIRVRVNESIAEELEKTGNISERVRELISKNSSEKSFVPQKDGAYIEGLTDGEVQDVKSMLDCFGVSFSDAFKALNEGLEEGYLTIEDGRLVGCEVDLSRFLEACEEKKVDPQKMIDKSTEGIYAM